LFSLTAYIGLAISSNMPEDRDYNLSLDFITQRKLEYFAKSENEFNTPLMDISELNAKILLGQKSIPIKISSMPEPLSDVSRDLLSYFITSEEDTNPFMLLSPTKAAKSYVDLTTQLASGVIKDSHDTQLVNLKTNGLHRHSYFKIDLPNNDDLDSLTIAEALNDKDFKSVSGKWKKIIDESNIDNKGKWVTEVSVYYQKDNDGNLSISHFLPVNLREFYE
tara:strand:+ start:47420 stop:48082 length:663 start_codon:yes stop_codon:yes gene_type:complete